MEEYVIVAVKGKEHMLLRQGDVMTIAQACCREAYKNPGPEWSIFTMSYERYLELTRDAS